MPKIKFFNCFEVKNETATSADLYFYGDIVSDYWGAWQEEDQYPEAIKNCLSGQQGKSLNIYINSGGGNVFAGIAIYNMIRRFAETASVKVHVDGLAGSIASVIAFSGSEPPQIPSNAFLMIHNPWALVEGNAADLRKMADDLDVITDGIVNVYLEHVKEGVTEEKIRELMDAETWMTGAEAAEYFDIETSESVAEIAAAAGEYVARSRNMPKDLTIQKAADAAKNEQSENQDARSAVLIQNSKKREEIARTIINSL